MSNTENSKHSHEHGHIDMPVRQNSPDETLHMDDQPARHIHHQSWEGKNGENSQKILTIRSYSGLSGDILLAGLAVLNMERQSMHPAGKEAGNWLGKLLEKILPDLKDTVKIIWRSVNGIGGWSARINLPHAHEHRNLNDILNIVANSGLSEKAAHNASKCFELLAECEAAVHGTKKEDIHFHEVGALDSILDICAVCELYDMLENARLICSPLPIADGVVNCAHGRLPAPAPAVLRLMPGIPVRPFEGDIFAGELVTPTAIALLRVLEASFGPWPAFCPDNVILAYGQSVFAHAPNGVVFAYGNSAE